MLLLLSSPSFAASLMLCQLLRRHWLLPTKNRFVAFHRNAVSAAVPLEQSSMMAINSETKIGSPTSLKCDPKSVSDKPSSQKNDGLSLSHMIKYLGKVEEILLSTSEQSPAMRYQHCYPAEDGRTFYKSVGAVLAKPMLRTLICGDVNANINDSVEGIYDATSKKIHFDKRIREARTWIEGQKMYSFAVNSLRQAAHSLDPGVRHEMVPDLLERIDALESRFENNSPSPINWSSGTKPLFSRLASGRRYKGKLDRLVSDLFPELLDEYHEAVRVASEREVYEFVINNHLVNAQKDQCEDGDQELTNKRVDAAFKCISRFYPVDCEHSISTPDKQNGSENGIESGKRCEESCMAFLHNKQEYHKILQNVYVNARRNNKQKYVPPKIERKMSANQKFEKSGIIWTDSLIGTARHGLCSEFDAVVLSSDASIATNIYPGGSNNIFVSSIWEAKKTISPSSLHDILSKKLDAVEALLDDTGAELIYGSGGATEVIPLSTEEKRLTFGIFCSELQRPEHAADSIRSIACSNVVNYNMMEVIRALDCSGGNDDIMVEVDLASALDIVHGLKHLVEETNRRNRADIKFFVEERVDFL